MEPTPWVKSPGNFWVGASTWTISPPKKENDTLPKFNSSPFKSYRNPKGKDRLPTTIFQGLLLLNFGGVILQCLIRFMTFHLVGGWTNPFEKYARQIGFIFPKDRGENKNVWNHHLVHDFFMTFHSKCPKCKNDLLAVFFSSDGDHAKFNGNSGDLIIKLLARQKLDGNLPNFQQIRIDRNSCGNNQHVRLWECTLEIT